MRLVSSTCAVLAVASAIAACSLTTSLDGLTGGDAGTSSPDAATGGGGEDAASTSDATARDAEVVRDGSTSSSSDGASTEASLTAGPNLVTDPSFETSCNDFTAYEGDLVWTTDSRTGGHDCRACKTGSTDDVVSFDDQGHFVKNPLVGETYHAEIWVRAVLTSGLTVALIAREQQSGKQINQVGSPRVDLGTDWQLVETDVTVDATGLSSLDFYVSVHGASFGSCFEVDDMVIDRLTP